jgi:hypothetical protein
MDSKKIFLTRIRIIAFVTMVIGAFFLYRLFTLQIIRTESYKETADRSYMKSADTFDRGTIFFEQKDGTRISAATVNSGFILSINPTQIKDIQETINTLSGVVVFDHDAFMMKAKKKNDPYEEITHSANSISVKNNKPLSIRGVDLKTHEYPGFSTDLQAPFTIYLTQATGECHSHPGRLCTAQAEAKHHRAHSSRRKYDFWRELSAGRHHSDTVRQDDRSAGHGCGGKNYPR